MLEFLKNRLDNFDSELKVINSIYLWAHVDRIQSKQSTQFGRKRSFTPAKKRNYVKELSRQLTSSEKISGDLRVTAIFCFPWRVKDKFENEFSWALMNNVPDVDNILKPVFDSIYSVIGDDSKIVECKARKIRWQLSVIGLRIDAVEIDY